MIATFSVWKKNSRTASNGILDPLMYYFTPRTENLLLLDQPYPGSSTIIPTLEIYKNSRLKKKQKIGKFIKPLSFLLRRSNKPGTHAIFKLRDVLSVIEAGMKQKKQLDLFIGLESANGMAGIFLRKMGKVKKVIYYVSDYSPRRFAFKPLNTIYLWMDRYCAKHSDYIWDVSPAMQPARIKVGLKKSLSSKNIVVPNALYKNQLNFLPPSKRTPLTIVFVGTLGLENGPDLLLKAFSYIAKSYPKSQLHIYGGGGIGFEEELLKKLTNELQLEDKVFFHGFISDQQQLSDTIKHYQIAVAPYKRIPGSIRLYGDATKLRLYMGSGLPVVSTDIPPLGKELAQYGAAIITKPTIEALTQGILELIEDKKKYSTMSEKAISFAEKNLWENSYDNALKEMGAIT